MQTLQTEGEIWAGDWVWTGLGSRISYKFTVTPCHTPSDESGKDHHPKNPTLQTRK